MKTLIIAEAGVNHNGDMSVAYRLVDAAKEAGADYVKFQTFIPQNLVSQNAQKAEYQKKTTDKETSQLQMLEKLALTQDNFTDLQRYCRNIGIGFISTPFDLDSIAFLDTLDLDFWKLPSGEITNLPYLEKIGQTKRKVVLSTGMCEINEISQAIRVLENAGSTDISLLHCNTEYPTPFEDVNLSAMNEMREVFRRPIGYSDHTIGIEVPIAAVAMGASIIEKHFTLDRNMEGPDHKASLEPEELKQMICAIRNIEKAYGDGHKKRSASETKNVAVARKSIVAKAFIKKGEVFSEDNITTKRPGNGISPMHWHEIIGTCADRDYKPDELIQERK